MTTSIAIVVAVVGALLLSVFLGMPVGIAVFTAASLAALVYVLRNVPRRYRRFGPGQQQQAVDNWSGQFGKAYPEDRVRSDEDPTSPSSRP